MGIGVNEIEGAGMPHIRRFFSTPRSKRIGGKSPIVVAMVSAVAVLSFAVSPLADATDDSEQSHPAVASSEVTSLEQQDVDIDGIGKTSKSGEDPKPGTDSNVAGVTEEGGNQGRSEGAWKEKGTEAVEGSTSAGVSRSEVKKRVPRSSRTGRASSQKFSCKPGVVYVLDITGKIRQYDSSSGGWGQNWVNTDPEIIGGYENLDSQFNALGIKHGGDEAWAVDRKHDPMRIWRYTPETGWRSVATIDKGPRFFENTSGDGRYYRTVALGDGIIGGAVGPDGTYYFGGFMKVQRYVNSGIPNLWSRVGWWDTDQRVVVLYSAKARADGIVDVKQVGYFPGIEYFGAYQNGDFEIDADGSLHVVNTGISQGTSKLQMAHVPAAVLNASHHEVNDQTIHIVSMPRMISITPAWPNPLSDQLGGTSNRALIDGVALDYDGGLFLGTVDRLGKIDPLNSEAIGKVVKVKFNRHGGQGYPGNTDLASCADASTLVVKKNIVDRKDPEDQFQLQAYAGTTLSGKYLGQKTTVGNRNGDQSLVGQDSTQLGPLLVNAGDQITVREILDKSENDQELAEKYRSELYCEYTVAGSDDPQPLNGFENGPKDVSQGAITIPTDDVTPSVTRTVCTFTNAPKGEKPEPFTVKATKYVKDGDQRTPTNGWTVTTKINDNSATFVDESSGDGQVSKLTAGDGRDKGSASWTLNPAEIGSVASVTVYETQKSGYKFDRGECTVNGSSNAFPVKANSSTGAPEAEVTGIKSGDEVVCEFVNAPLGSLRWNKVDPEGNLLSGSEWKLVGPGDEGSVGTETVIKDCTSAECKPPVEGALYDQNAKPGVFQVNGLDWGSYTLTETKAPTGFVKNVKRTFQIDPQSPTQLNVDLKNLENQRQEVPTLPLTGGLGSDLFLIVGGLIGGAGLLAGLYAWRKRRVRAAGQ